MTKAIENAEHAEEAEDRGSKIENREESISILDPRSSILDPRSSTSCACSALPPNPKFTYSDRHKRQLLRYQKCHAKEIAENFRAVFDALLRSVMLGRDRCERHRDQQTEQDQSRKMRHAFLPIPMS